MGKGKVRVNYDISKYQRQTSLRSFGTDKQQKLLQSKVLIIGLGGLGVPVAQYLNAMGIGTLGLMDGDTIAIHNLHRQVLYAEKDIGKRKVDVAAQKLKAQNYDTHIVAIPSFLKIENALKIIKGYDVVVDATDNFETRYLINDACVILSRPFVYGALHDFEGQVSVFNYQDGPTYRCLFPNMPKPEEIPNCDAHGVLGILPGIIGSLQALEVVKVLTKIGEVLSGKLLLFDGLSQENRFMRFQTNPKNKTISTLATSYGVPLCAAEIQVEWEVFLKKHASEQLVDVRSSKEFQYSHLDNTVNIPLSELEDSLDQINLKETIYFVCQSGKRSLQAVEKLKMLSPNTVSYSLKGGMNEMVIT